MLAKLVFHQGGVVFGAKFDENWNVIHTYAETEGEAQAFMGATLTIGLIFANLLGGNILHWFDINVLLASLLFFAVLGCIFAFSTLLIDGKKENLS